MSGSIAVMMSKSTGISMRSQTIADRRVTMIGFSM